MTATTILPRTIISATAPVLAEAVALFCAYCGHPIDAEDNTWPVEAGLLHLDCHFQGGYDDEHDDVDPDALYDAIGDR